MPKNLTNVIIKVLYIENQDITILEKRTEVYMKEKRRGMGMRLCMIQILLSFTISGCSDMPRKKYRLMIPSLRFRRQQKILRRMRKKL